MNQQVKFRLLVASGVVLMAATVLIVLYGFKRTDELRAESHVSRLMAFPKPASFGGAPVGLVMGAGSTAEPAEGIAEFDDGMTAMLVGVEERPCPACEGKKEFQAALLLAGGSVPSGGRDVYARLSPTTSPQWSDYGYTFSLLDVGNGFVVFSVDKISE